MKPGIKRRRAVVSSSQLVKSRPLFEDRLLPLLVEPAVVGVSLTDWVRTNQDSLNQWLYKHGGVLLRGFAIQNAQEFEAVVAAASGELLAYKERSSPRHQVSSGNVYTSTDYPNQYDIFLHNENSYQGAWPLKVFFFCNVAPTTGGETPLADCRRIYARIPDEIINKFKRLGINYMRNYGQRYGLPWQSVFGSEDKAGVEEQARLKGIELEWKDDGNLRGRVSRPLVDIHPVTGQTTWFNHGTFFHITTRDPEVRDALLREMAEEDLPSNTYYGDGSPIEAEVLDQLRAIYLEEKVMFPWQQGDVLVIDNMLTAHGRSPYEGERQILVAMTEPVQGPDPL